MDKASTRRDVLRAAAAVAGTRLVARAASFDGAAVASPKPVRVVVWDEQQPSQKTAYEDFLGNAIAQHLRTLPGFSVRSARLDDPGQGLAEEILGPCDVVVWWGHARHPEVAPEAGRRVVERIKEGTLALIALHSAHWSTPFVEAMNERARIDARKALAATADTKIEIEEVPPPRRYTVPKSDARLTPALEARKFPDGRIRARLHLPFCCFPAYRADGKPSTVRVLKPGHPLTEGLPDRFEIAQTEMYDEPFHVPEPDEVVLEERWGSGEWFRCGMVWRLGKGRVFYFRPGHETYPVYRAPLPLRVIANAARWLPTGA